MAKFRDVKTLQKFAAVHASIQNHFNLERHLNHRETFKTEPLYCPGRVAATGGPRNLCVEAFSNPSVLL